MDFFDRVFNDLLALGILLSIALYLYMKYKSKSFRDVVDEFKMINGK